MRPRLRKGQRLFCFSLLLTIRLYALAQQTPIIRSTTRLVSLNVAVTDNRGRPVEGLGQDDFRIFDNGVPAQIRYFSVDRAAGSSPAALPDDVVSNEPERRTSHAVTVILLDTVNIGFSDLASAGQQVIRILSQLQPSDRVGLYVLGNEVRILHEFTEPAEALVRKVASGMRFDLHPSVDGNVIRTFVALEAIAHHLSSRTGRKSLIWISSAFPLIPDFGGSMQPGREEEKLRPSETELKLTWPAAYSRALSALSGADVAVYPLDARGLSAEPQWDPTPWGRKNAPKPLATSKNRTMIDFASHTGGRAFFDDNDMKSAIQRVIDSSRVSYSLGFYPASARGDGSFHKISVRLNRRGLSVHCRRGYFDKVEESFPESALDAALGNSPDATGLGIRARAWLSGKPKPKLSVEVEVEPEGVFAGEEAGQRVIRLELAVVPMDDRGRKYPAVVEAITLRRGLPGYREFLRTGAKLERTLDLDERATRLKIAVRDRQRGAIGSVVIPASKFREP